MLPNIAALIPHRCRRRPRRVGLVASACSTRRRGINLEPVDRGEKKFNVRPPQVSVKLKNGELESGFHHPGGEREVTRQFVLPGSAANKISAPKDADLCPVQGDRQRHRDPHLGSLSPAPVEVKDHGGFVEGELASIGCVVHLTNNADGDAFQVVSRCHRGVGLPGHLLVRLRLVISPSPTGVRRPARSPTTLPLRRFALRWPPSMTLLADWAVAGSAGGPYTITPPAAGAITGSGAGLTGGTFSVAPA